MTRKTKNSLAAWILLLASACTSDTAVAPEARDRTELDHSSAVQEIEAILEAYGQAVREMNLDLFLAISVDPDDVSIVSPIGRVGSMPELEAFFEGLQATYSELGLLFSNTTIRSEGPAAWATFDFTVDAVLADGQSVQFGGWETQFYRKTDQGWRIAHVHYSVPPESAVED